MQIGATNYVKVSTAGSPLGSGFSGALTEGGSLFLWGENNRGQLGQNNVILRSSPVQVPGKTFVDFACSQSGVAAIASDGTLWTWGAGGFGTLGDGTTANRSSPVQVGSDNTWYQIYGGTDYMIGVKTNKTIWKWGRSSPVQIGSNLQVFSGGASYSEYNFTFIAK